MNKDAYDRRRFLSKLSFAVIGTSLLSSQWFYAFVAKDQSPFAGYYPYSKQKNDLRCAKYSGTTLKVSGTTFARNGLRTLSYVRIEVWHLSPDSKKYDHKGAFSSNASGEYTFITDMPNRIKGQLPRIFFKISHDGRVDFTELILNDHNAYISHTHWENNKALNEKLFPIYKNKLGETEIQFNVTV